MADTMNKANKRQAAKKKVSPEMKKRQTERNKARRIAKQKRIEQKQAAKIERRIALGKPVHHRHLLEYARMMEGV